MWIFRPTTAYIFLVACNAATVKAQNSTDNGSVQIPQYECEQIVRNRFFASSDVIYDSSVAPIIDSYSADGLLNVNVLTKISEYGIVGHGVGGGSIKITGTIRFSWTDERLKWNPAQDGGCTKVLVDASRNKRETEIWIPDLRIIGNVGDDGVNNKAEVYPSGLVTWENEFEVEAHCQEASRSNSSMIDFTKRCEISFGNNNNNGVYYNFDDVVESVNVNTIPGYNLNTNLTLMSADSKEVSLTIYLDLIETSCSLCGGVGKIRKDVKAPIYSNEEDDYFYDKQNWTCQQIEDNITKSFKSITDEKCQEGLLDYSAFCCDGATSESICEDNIRAQVLTAFAEGTVTPPDGSSLGLIDVDIDLDFLHVMDIDMKENTLTVLVTLELEWTDNRLAWDPFIGGCYSVSYRASPNPEETEIWVPECDLLNKVEGVEGLPLSHATVSYDGGVDWKRTGVLTVACEMKGLKQFPFDRPTCNMDFGAERSPAAHRVQFITDDYNKTIEFSDKVQNKALKYQEYQVAVGMEKVTNGTMLLSEYENRFIRFHFVFERTTSYYVWGFVVLYILFTYMAFGMFLLRPEQGERLGLGTGILFVIVAQDITLSERTPVTQERLWIDNLSFTSKLYVIFGIFQSLFVLWYYFVKDLDDKDNDDDDNDDSNNNEVDGDKGEKECLMMMETGKDDDDRIFHSDLNGNGFKENGDFGTKDVDHNPSTTANTANNNTSTHNTLISFFDKNVLHYDPSQDSKKRRTIRRLRRWDNVTFWLFVISYTIFIIAYWVGGKKEGDNAN